MNALQVTLLCEGMAALRTNMVLDLFVYSFNVSHQTSLIFGSIVTLCRDVVSFVLMYCTVSLWCPFQMQHIHIPRRQVSLISRVLFQEVSFLCCYDFCLSVSIHWSSRSLNLDT